MMIYLAAPVRAADGETIESNLARAKRWLRHVILSYDGVHPIAPWITCCEVLDDTIESNRNRGFRLNEAVIARCEALWLVGPRISSGMLEEARMARRWGIPVFDFTGMGAEPPATPGKMQGEPFEVKKTA